jgi:3-hydroxyisobutyrate dehydrogenase-like beta-hydroxyacid dehydrogenase
MATKKAAAASSAKPKVGFIGVGMMGHGMAKNLAEKGFPTTVMGHRNRQPVDDLKKRGCKEAKTIAALVDASDVILLCVTGTPQVEEKIYGEGGIIAAAKAQKKKGLIVIDTSTAEPDSSAKIHADCKKAGVVFVDAPLGRTPKEAEEGRLNTMVGCDAKTYKAIEPVLAAYSENIIHVGTFGAGHKVKLLNNFYAMSTAALASELVAAAEKSGVELPRLYDAMSRGPLFSPFFKLVVGGALENDYTQLKFALKNGYKDIGYFKRMSDNMLMIAPMTAAAYESLKAANGMGYGEEYVPSLIKAQRRLNGLGGKGR